MKKITYIIALAAMAFAWTSCDKDKDEVKPVTKTYKEDEGSKVIILRSSI